MTQNSISLSNKFILTNIIKLLGCLSPRRRLQIVFLFIIQLSTAALELLSIGTIIPFLNALTDIQKLMQNHYIRYLIDWLHISDPQHLIIVLAIIFSGGIVIANLFRFFTLFIQQYLSAAIAVDIGDILFSKTLHKPYSYFLNNNSSELIGNTTNDLNGALGTIHCFFSIITQGLITLFITAGLLIYNTGIALLLSVIITFLYSIIMLIVSRRLRHNSKILSDSYRNMLQVLQEGFGGVRYIILDRLQNNFAIKYKQADKRFRWKNAENNVIQQTPKLFLEALGVIAISIITIQSTAQGKDISTIIPLVGFLVFSAYRLLPAIQQIYSSISGIIALSVSLSRVIEIVAKPNDKKIQKPVRCALNLKNAITFENVFFDYNGIGNDWTLEDLNFSITAKTTVALVGHTGSGKSTTADLILGLIRHQKGLISIDGIPLNDENLAEWQAGIAHVPQSIFLSDATIAENIAFGIPYEQIDIERVKKVATLAQVDTFIESLPEGYAQKCGERGIRLSGGQRQRIGIARALYQNASVIVFDEATSALDNKTEQDVVEAIGRLKEDITIILIAHRLSTLKYADSILMFEKGHIVAQGTYQELLSNPNFRELVKSSHLNDAA